MLTTRGDDESENKDEECGANGCHPHRDHRTTRHTRYYPNPFTKQKSEGAEEKPNYLNPESIKISEKFQDSPLQ